MPMLVFAQVALDPSSLVSLLLQAAQGKHWIVVVGVVLSLVTYGVRTWIVPGWKWAQTDRGGAVLALAVAVLGTVGAALAGGSVSFWTLADALAAAMASAGGYSLLRKIVRPSDTAAAAPAP